MKRALVMSGLLLLGGCDKHPLQGGTYVFTAGQHAPTDDPCVLAPDGGSLWTALVVTSGEVVSVAYLIDGNSPGVLVEGSFKNQVYGKGDSFDIDGTGHDVTAELNADAGAYYCAADFVQIHIDANVDSPTQFSGSLTVNYTLTSTGTLDSDCPQNPTCELQTPFTATRVGP